MWYLLIVMYNVESGLDLQKCVLLSCDVMGELFRSLRACTY